MHKSFRPSSTYLKLTCVSRWGIIPKKTSNDCRCWEHYGLPHCVRGSLILPVTTQQPTDDGCVAGAGVCGVWFVACGGPKVVCFYKMGGLLERPTWSKAEDDVVTDWIARESKSRPLGRIIRCPRCCYNVGIHLLYLSYSLNALLL